MVKTLEKSWLFEPDFHDKLSILESRKNNPAVVDSISGRLQSRSTPKRIDQCREAGHFYKRTSEILFIDKWYRPGERQNRARTVCQRRPEVFSLAHASVNVSILDLR